MNAPHVENCPHPLGSWYATTNGRDVWRWLCERCGGVWVDPYEAPRWLLNDLATAARWMRGSVADFDAAPAHEDPPAPRPNPLEEQ